MNRAQRIKLTYAEVCRIPIQLVVDDASWQALRASFVKTWKLRPEANCARLRQYLDRDPTCALRLRRVMNYLTGSAFRTGKISHASIDALLTDVRARIAREREAARHVNHSDTIEGKP